jgi:hypothetical protein
MSVITEEEFLEKIKGVKDLKKMISLYRTLVMKNELKKSEGDGGLKIVDAKKNGDGFDYTAKHHNDLYEIKHGSPIVVTCGTKTKSFDNIEHAIEEICKHAHAKSKGKDSWND